MKHYYILSHSTGKICASLSLLLLLSLSNKLLQIQQVHAIRPLNPSITHGQKLGQSDIPSSSLLNKHVVNNISKLPHLLPSHLTIRGGGRYDDFDDEEDDDSDFNFSDDEEDELFGLDVEGFDDSDDFAEQSTLSRAWNAFTDSPPLTKIYLTAAFAASLIGYIQNKNEFPSVFLLNWKLTLTRMQFWRPITAFLNFGPLSLGWLMTAHFVWTYMSTLERLNHATPYEFWYMIFFGCTSMILGYTCLKIPPRFLGHNLSTFLVYVWSRYHEGLEVNMFEMFNTRAEMLPWFFLAQTFLLEGEVPILDLLGIAFGHVYHYLRGVGGIGRCPPAVKEWYENGTGDVVEAIRGEYKKISSDFVMQ